MRLSRKQQLDLETIEFFIPQNFTGRTVYPCGAIESPDGNSPERVFFDYSDKGIKFRGRLVTDLKRLEQLIQGKRWRGIMMEEYENSILAGDIPYIVLLQGMPRVVVDFMKKEMFKGAAAESIEVAYQEVLTS